MTEHRTSILSRMFIVLGLIFLLPCALVFQLLRINYIEGEGLRELWSEQTIGYVAIPAQRGNIYDANNTLLATNLAEYKISVDPTYWRKVGADPEFSQQKMREFIEKLAEITPPSSSDYYRKLKVAPSNSEYVTLARNQPPTVKEEIENLNNKAVIIEQRFRRKYTFGSLASHSIGFVNYNLDGRTGLESFYNKELKGIDGSQQIQRDRQKNIIKLVGAPTKLPVEGFSLHTTIDSYIQAILEDELKAGVDKYQANYGTGIILDPKTGAIKALANYPTFDPNFPGNDDDINRRNFAVSDMVEPGSTFKLVTAIAAVEQQKVDFEEVFETPENGEVVIHGLTLRDHNPLGNMDFSGVMRQSSNVATAEIAMRMDKDKFYQYARNMGFGTPTYVDLAGEENGRLAKPYEWSLVSLPWMSHGYELLATPIQVAQAYAAFANNGLMMRPYLVERIEDKQGNIISEHEPVEIRRIAKKKTLDVLLPVFESVVSDSGTGEYAQVDGLRIAGKTGTAKKVVDGRYTNKYRGSFVGFFPVEDPKYVCLILLDEPKPIGYGGYTAGPIFRQVATRIAGLDSDIQRQFQSEDTNTEIFALSPNVEGLPVEQAKKILSELDLKFKVGGKTGIVLDQEPAAGTKVSTGKEILLTLSETYSPVDSASINEGLAEIPDLKGMSMRSASNLLTSLGLKSTLIGSGTVFTQFPKAGELMRKGSEVTIRGKAKSLETITEANKK